MFETHLTVVGKLVTGVEQRRFADGGVVANFRIMGTERRYDQDARSWADGDRLFLDVVCRRRLAENTFASLVKGDIVVVIGRVYTREFEHEGRRRSTVTLDARSVGVDLSRCTAVVNRADRRAEEPVGAETEDDDHRAPDDTAALVGAAPGGGA